MSDRFGGQFLDQHSLHVALRSTFRGVPTFLGDEAAASPNLFSYAVRRLSWYRSKTQFLWASSHPYHVTLASSMQRAPQHLFEYRLRVSSARKTPSMSSLDLLFPELESAAGQISDLLDQAASARPPDVLATPCNLASSSKPLRSASLALHGFQEGEHEREQPFAWQRQRRPTLFRFGRFVSFGLHEVESILNSRKSSSAVLRRVNVWLCVEEFFGLFHFVDIGLVAGRTS